MLPIKPIERNNRLLPGNTNSLITPSRVLPYICSTALVKICYSRLYVSRRPSHLQHSFPVKFFSHKLQMFHLNIQILRSFLEHSRFWKQYSNMVMVFFETSFLYYSALSVLEDLANSNYYITYIGTFLYKITCFPE